MAITVTLFRTNPYPNPINIQNTILSTLVIPGANIPINLSVTDYPDVTQYGTGTYTYTVQFAVDNGDMAQYSNLNISGLRVRR